MIYKKVYIVFLLTLFKNKGTLNDYPIINDIIVDNTTLLDYYDGDFDNFDIIKNYCFTDITNYVTNYEINKIKKYDISNNNEDIDNILNNNNLTYDLFIKSLFPGVYDDALKPSQFYEECYCEDPLVPEEDINICETGYKFLGYKVISNLIKLTLDTILEYMINNNIKILKINNKNI